MVFFDANSSVLSEKSKAILDNAISAYEVCNQAPVFIQGHTDRVGPADKNTQLSRQIANSVRSYLVSRGVPANKITVKAYGEAYPLVATNDDAPEPQNRRAEITFGSLAGLLGDAPVDEPPPQSSRMGRSERSAPAAGGERVISETTRATAAKQHLSIVEEFGGEVSPELSAYVRSVGAKITNRTNIEGGAGSFRVTTLNSPVMNAFAVPGGYLYITRQILALANDEAELASIIGHEAGHIVGRHSSERKRANILSQLLALLSRVATGEGQLGQLFGQATKGFVLSYGRKQELESDDSAVRYLAEAGYDPLASASLLRSLGAATALEARATGRKDERSTPSWARTHPLSADRVARATSEAQRMSRAIPAPRNRDQYLARIDGLLIDDDPKQGTIEGSSFKHPDLRLGFTVPTGYGMQNGIRAVSIVGQGGQAQFSGGAYSGDLSGYLAKVFGAVAGPNAQIRYAAPRATNVNGVESAYATARVATQSGTVDLTVFAYRWSPSAAFHFATITPGGTELGPFSEMVRSLRRLSPAEAAAIRPRVIDVVTVGTSDSIESLAERMAYDDLKTERFRVLNGLFAGEKLVPGQKVKIVVFGTR